MREKTQGVQLQAPELDHQVLEAHALVDLDLPERRRLPPADIVRADDVGGFAGGGVQPVMAPPGDGTRPALVVEGTSTAGRAVSMAARPPPARDSP